MTQSANKPKIILILVVFVVLLAAAGGVFLIRDLRGLSFTVQFSDAGGLVENSPVEYRGLRIGSVSGLKVSPAGPVEVLIKIDSKQAKFIRENALFVITREPATGPGPGILMGFCKESDPEKLPPLKDGAVIEGVDSQMMFTVKTSVGCFNKVMDSFSDTLDKFKEKMNRTLDSRDLKKRFEEIEKYLTELNKKSQSEIKRYLEEKGPQMREKIDQLIRDLEKAGYPELAEQLRKLLQDKDQGRDPLKTT